MQRWAHTCCYIWVSGVADGIVFSPYGRSSAVATMACLFKHVAQVQRGYVTNRRLSHVWQELGVYFLILRLLHWSITPARSTLWESFQAV
jgi:hypothetical protein